MSNKEKKRFKKERTQIKKLNLSSELSKLENEISDLEYRIEVINKKIIGKESELSQFIENKKEYTLLDLINLQKKYLNVNNNPVLKKNKGRGITKSVSFPNSGGMGVDGSGGSRFAGGNKNSDITYNNSGIVRGGIRQYHSLNHRDYSTARASAGQNKKFKIDSPIYLELQRILNNSSFDEDTQIKIEQFLNNQGSLLLKQKIDQNLDLNYNKLNPYIINYLKSSIDELEKLIDHYRININKMTHIDNGGYVESLLITNLSNEEIISQLLGRFLRIISNNNLFNKNTNCTELASDLGQSLLYIFYSNEYKKNQLKGVKEPLEGLSKFIDTYYQRLNQLACDSVLINIGLKLLSFLEECGLIHSKIYILAKDHKNHIFVANDQILNSIGKNMELLNISYKIPMIVPPKKYGRDLSSGKEILGGFLLNDKEFVMPLIIKNSELKEQSIIKDQNNIFDMINNLSSVGYKINTAVLEFILEKGLDFGLFTDPNFKHPLEIKKNTAGRRKLTFLEEKKLAAFLSIKQLEMNILGLALIFKKVPEFFIPVRIDNRGRVYCMVDYLNYQGIELAKSLLLFSKGEKIKKFDKESIEYLKIFGANCFGNGIDKKSYNDRVEWVNNNEEDILNFRGAGGGKLIMEADSKLLFIAFCFEYINYYSSLNSNEDFYISHFPIQLDATCNGYQHLSLLTGDEPLAGELNLVSGDDDSIPKDFYSFVALKVNDYLKQKLIKGKKILAESNLENVETKKEVESCEILLKLNKNRSLVKLPIMVKPYNASLYQMVNYIKDKFDMVTVPASLSSLSEASPLVYEGVGDNNENSINTEFKIENKIFFVDKNNPDIKLSNNDLYFFITTMEQVIYNEFPKLKEFNLYLKKVADICTTLNINITWTVPSGLTVNQFYVDSEAIRLKPFKYRKTTFNINIKTDKINKGKQIRALMPNLIHSLDAASLSLIIDLYFHGNDYDYKRINFFAIHDCFAVTANNIVNLIKIIKLVYIKIYSDDSYLKRFDQGIINSIKSHFGIESFDDETKTIKVNGQQIKYPDVDKIIIGQIKASKIMQAKSIVN